MVQSKLYLSTKFYYGWILSIQFSTVRFALLCVVLLSDLLAKLKRLTTMYLLSLKTTTIYYFVNLQSFAKESHKNNSCLNLTQDSNSESYDSPLIDLHLIFEKLSLKNQVEELDFLSISNLIFTACAKSKFEID